MMMMMMMIYLALFLRLSSFFDIYPDRTQNDKYILKRFTQNLFIISWFFLNFKIYTYI